MERHLVVTQTFGDYAVGDRITDQEEVAKVLSTHAHAVVATLPVEPQEEEEPTLLEAPSAKPVAVAPAAPDKVKK